AACVWWLCGSSPPAAPGHCPAAAALAPAAAPPSPEQGSATPTPASGVRVALDPSARARATGLPLIRRVVDDNSAPLAKAVVTCSRPFASGMEDFDPRELGFDPARIADRMRALAKQRVEVETAADGTFRIAVAAPWRSVDLRVCQRGFQL